MMNKKLLPAAVAVALFAGVPAMQVKADIEGNVALVTDYRFRGISQSNDNPAVQGGFDYSWENGIYIGTWGSVVDFDLSTADGGLNGSLELDYYVGWSSNIGDSDFGIDVGYIYYDYPGDEGVEGDYQEVYLGFSWKDLGVSINYSDDYYAESGSFYYLSGDYSWSINDTFSMDFHVGLNEFDDKDVFLSDGDSYVDYLIGVNAEWLSVTWSLQYIGTDLDGDEYFDLDDLVDDTVVFGISKAL